MRLSSIGRRRVDRDPMVDIEKLLLNYAWNELSDANIFDRIFKKKKFVLEVNWNYLDISHHLSSFKIRQHTTNASETSKADKLKDKVLQRDLCLFRTEFLNNSDNTQNFTLKAERKTTSRCDVSIQRGFRMGSHVDVRLTIPTSPAPGGVDSCRITGGLSGELQISKSTGQSFEESLSWEVNNQVNVSRHTRLVASLQIREEDLMADFSVCSTIRATNHVIPVYVKDCKNKRILEILEIPAANLADILGECRGFERQEDCEVTCETKGTMRAIYGAEQMVHVQSFPQE